MLVSLPLPEYLKCAVNAHGFFHHKLGCQAVNLIFHSTGGSRHLAGMQAHMTFLDAFGSQGTQRCQVLSQTYCGNDFAQFCYRLYPHQLEVCFGCRMHFGSPTNNSQG